MSMLYLFCEYKAPRSRVILKNNAELYNSRIEEYDCSSSKMK